MITNCIRTISHLFFKINICLKKKNTLNVKINVKVFNLMSVYNKIMKHHSSFEYSCTMLCNWCTSISSVEH